MTVIRQVAPPAGAPKKDDFEAVTLPIPERDDNQLLVENLYLSVDPYMRELMEWGGWELAGGLLGDAIGRVLESSDPTVPVGSIVRHRHGWRTHALPAVTEVTRIHPADGVPLSAYLGILGLTGFTAYVGLVKIAALRPGDDLFISAAAGAVGGATAQIARLLGARRIVGSAGSAAKIAYLTEKLGLDAAFDYHAGSVTEQLAEAAPDGIDVYFDNVGGDHLEAAIAAMKDHGRIAACGAVAQYNNLRTPPAAPHNLFDIVEKNLRLEGYLADRHLNSIPEFERFLVPRVQDGTVLIDEVVVDGIENTVDAFIGMLRGENIGKMLVRVAE
ncbi:putative NADP-dependent oxidoreductase [Actinoalloteichus hymeniacidonis]|uniref:NADP-dependent oxidoreductase n=2 Tax=Actinoalloteichus hymeniacidonis TaxID=340345 RepID=A0AAC9HRQ0_9PSEU|nr:putative NADP-dependent oxidoreductase [Actinoalloteichus hymeniacidonis]